MKKILAVFLCSILFISIVPQVSKASTLEEENESITENDFETLTVIEEYDENEKVISKTIIADGELEEDDFDIVKENDFETLKETDGNHNLISPFQNVNDGSMNYVLQYTFTGTNSNLNTLKEWTSRFAAAAIPAGLIKSKWVTAAALASFETFYNPPATRYYKTWIYQAKDHYYYYGKAVSKQYSDSKRTKVTKTVTKYVKSVR